MVNNAACSKYLDNIESWQPSIPLWEKQFCASVCLIPWETICEKKRVLAMYEKVAKWDDSAGEEAFHNAKARYWAEINGLPCDIPLPDPDAYNDVIDHDPVLDPLLLEELNNLPSAESEEDSSDGWDFLLVDQPVPADGPVEEVPTLNKRTEQNSTVPLNDVYHGNASFYFGQKENNDGYGNFANRPNN
ncbi:hypothetical protein IHE45_12G044900 [Dioscorea alata]|uniref:Uncharacterized protein n=1 Tax=Dioscorea alata TaxID=55571 RepID=A0ACB7V1L3_DIOAL|nr:hypothetical protein IHE45_12G044900 [Dioscorea alata]